MISLSLVMILGITLEKSFALNEIVVIENSTEPDLDIGTPIIDLSIPIDTGLPMDSKPAPICEGTHI